MSRERGRTRSRGGAVVVAGALLALGAGVARAQPTDDEPPKADFEAFIEMGSRQMGEGDFANAIFSFEMAADKLKRRPSKRGRLAETYLSLGACHANLGEEQVAREKFRLGLDIEPNMRINRETFPPKVVRLYEAERLRSAAKHSRRTRIIVIGAAAGVGAGGGYAIGKLKPAREVFHLPPNRAPAVAMSVYPEQPVIRDVTIVTFTASVTDPDGDTLHCSWDFGDGTSATGVQATHRFRQQGTFLARLTVTDGQDHTVTREQNITVRSLAGRWKDDITELGDVCASAIIYTLAQNGESLSGSAPTNVHPVTLTGAIVDPRYVVLERTQVPIEDDAGRCGTGWAYVEARCLATVSDDMDTIECPNRNLTLTRQP